MNVASTKKSRSEEKCARILFICEPGLEYFGAGPCGCGCRPQVCGTIAGIQCPKGFRCRDDRSDDCKPKQGDSDCSGRCIEEKRKK